MPDGQKLEVKSGETISNTQQLREMGKGAMADTGKPLKVMPTNPNATVTGPAKENLNLDFTPPKQQ
jgi:hypothetical protein